MRKYEATVAALENGLSRTVATLPPPLKTQLQARHVLNDPEHFKRALDSPAFVAAFVPYKDDVPIRARIYAIGQVVYDIYSIQRAVAEFGGVATYDKIRSQVLAILHAPSDQTLSTNSDLPVTNPNP